MIKEEQALEAGCLSLQTERLRIDAVKAKNEINHKLSGFISKYTLIAAEIKEFETKSSQLETENQKL
jgi:hypothetical protein